MLVHETGTPAEQGGIRSENRVVGRVERRERTRLSTADCSIPRGIMHCIAMQRPHISVVFGFVFPGRVVLQAGIDLSGVTTSLFPQPGVLTPNHLQFERCAAPLTFRKPVSLPCRNFALLHKVHSHRSGEGREKHSLSKAFYLHLVWKHCCSYDLSADRLPNGINFNLQSPFCGHKDNPWEQGLGLHGPQEVRSIEGSRHSGGVEGRRRRSVNVRIIAVVFPDRGPRRNLGKIHRIRCGGHRVEALAAGCNRC